jgi:phage gp16-like protein
MTMKDTHKPRHPRRGAAISHRNRDLAIIHLAKKQLALDDDTYRALLLRVAGKPSSRDMSVTERGLVIAEFARLGFKAPTGHGKANFPNRPKTADDVPMLLKVEALLTDAKRPWSYAHAMAKQMFNVDRLEFLREEDLYKVVQALEVDARRRSKAAGSRRA